MFPKECSDSTTSNSNCTKVMFLHVCHSVCPQRDVYPSMQWAGGVYPSMQWEICFWVQGVYITLGRHLTLADTPTLQMATAADGMHPTGMHSCL